MHNDEITRDSHKCIGNINCFDLYFSSAFLKRTLSTIKHGKTKQKSRKNDGSNAIPTTV